MSSKSSQNTLASAFQKLHQSGDPVVVINVWDAFSAAAAASVPGVKALATASYAIAATYGVKDNDLRYEQNMEAVAKIAPVAHKYELPLSVDMQDGYEDIAASITELIKLGVVGANIEDLDNRSGKLRPKEQAVERIKTALEAAKAAGVPNFAINARTDVVGQTGSIDEAIDRAKAFLDAGATTAFVWGGGTRGLRDAEVQKLITALDGRLSVIARAKGMLTVDELRRMGVARINVGPRLQFEAIEAIKVSVAEIING